jgi:REP element-mobilizing transposase RayT
VAFPWLQDLDIAAQHLARLSLESAAKAALIAQGDRLFAYAGEFPQPLASELAGTVGQQWNRRRGSDLAQFVKLDDGLEYMMYATHLVDDLVLALIFDAKMPFSKIRNQATRLAQALSTDQEGRRQLKDNPSGRYAPARVNPPAPDIPEDWIMVTPDQEELIRPGDTRETQIRPAGVDLEMQDQAPTAPLQEDLDWLPEQLAEDAASLFDERSSEMPPFDIPDDWQPTSGDESGSRSFLENLLKDPLPAAKFPYEEEEATPSALDQTQPSWLPDPDENFRRQPYYPSPDKMAETRPTSVPQHKNTPVQRLEPESASFFHATYACVLVPRLPQHHLVRDLAKMLEEWMPQICVSFDWRIEQLAIRPDYMQWMVRVHSATAPRYMMQIIARITSDKIFFNLPRLADENPSGEFWAPGWLLISGDKMPPPRMVQDFIHNTRKRQGLD